MPTTSLNLQEVDEENTDELFFNEGEPISVSFSGGGIRSGAFCYGVLEHLINRKADIQEICCVSGGGYTGSSFVQTVLHNMKKHKLDYREAAAAYFERGRLPKKPGFLLNCKNFGVGLIDALCLLLIAVCWLFVTILTFVPLWLFSAVLIDAIFGKLLRSSNYEDISWVILGLFCYLIVSLIIWKILQAYRKSALFQRFMNLVLVTSIFSLLLLLLLGLIAIERNSIMGDGTTLVHTTIGSILFLLVFLPLLTKCVPGNPVGFISLLIYVVFMSIICCWRIYRADSNLIFLGDYSQTSFNIVLGISAIAYLFPFGLVQKTMIHHYYRWRLQKRFYANTGLFGCAGILSGRMGCGGDVVKLGDFAEYKEDIPMYMASLIVNGWKSDINDPHSYKLMTLKTDGRARMVGTSIEFDASYYQLSSAMTASAAALAYNMGKVDNTKYRFWQTSLGLGIGNWFYTQWAGKSRWIILFLCQFPFSLISAGIIFWNFRPMLMLIPFLITGALIVFGTLAPPGSKWCRWAFYSPTILIIHQTLELSIVGGDPLPPQFYLSDGAHGDNLALLPLLELKKKKILLCDGSRDVNEDSSALLNTIELAREWLQCSFKPYRRKGEPKVDIEEAIKLFAKNKDATYLRLKVSYGPNYDEEGEILYIKGRRAFAEENLDSDIAYLNGCCCEWCHSPKCACCNSCCGTFPQHSTGNQFFTSRLFARYRELGYTTAVHSLHSKRAGHPVTFVMAK